jgi:hypothetical protein
MSAHHGAGSYGGEALNPLDKSIVFTLCVRETGGPPFKRGYPLDASSALAIRSDRRQVVRQQGAFNPVWYRAFIDAAIENAAFAQAYLDHIARDLLGAITQAVRLEFDYPGIATLPAREREVEVV